MNAYLLEGRDDGGNVVCRAIVHECGCYKRLASKIVSKRTDVASIDSRILSIEEVKQISPMGGEYLSRTMDLADRYYGLSVFAVEIIDETAVTLWGPSPQFVLDVMNGFSD